MANAASLEASKGGLPEFNALMEKEEGERIDEARKNLLAEQERWKGILLAKEKELEELNAKIEEAGRR